MKRIFTLLTFLLVTLSVFSQVQMGQIDLQKKSRQAVVLYTQYSQEIVEGAIKEKMDQLGNKGKENKSLISLSKSNFYEFKGARLPNAHRDVDLYFKTERRGGKNKDESAVYLVVGKGPDDFATTTTDPDLMDKAKELMEKLLPYIEAYKLEQDIKAQEELVKKVNMKMTDLGKDSTDLQKKVLALQEKQTQNSTDQSTQRTELEKQMQILEALKGRRKN